MSPADLKLWLHDRQPKSVEQMARLADEYLALRKSFAVSTENFQVSNETVLLNARTQKHVPYKTLHFEKGNKTPTPGCRSFETNESVKQKPFTCFWCNKPSHKIYECR